jgi:hypothetical protein
VTAAKGSLETPGLPGVLFAPSARRAAAWLACRLAAAPGHAAATAPAHSPALDRVSVWAGAFLATSDTTVTASARAGDYSASGRFNLERDLGLDDARPVGHARIEWLVGHSQGFALEVFGFERSNRVSLSRDIEYDGQVYRASASVAAGLDYRFSSAAYRWWMGRQDTVWGLGLGVAHYRVETWLEAEASLDDASIGARSASDDAALAPLLALGWRHAVSPRLRLYADASGVAKDGGPLQGHIMDAAIGLEWFPTRRLGLAAEYGATHVRLDRRRDAVDARLDLKLRGPSLFLRLR